jgi:hypothetical protein
MPTALRIASTSWCIACSDSWSRTGERPSAIQPMACPAQRQCCTRDRVDCERQHCPLLSLGLDDEPRERPDDRPQSAP